MNYLPEVISSLTVSALFAVIINNIYDKIKELDTSKADKPVCDEKHLNISHNLTKGEQSFKMLIDKQTQILTEVTEQKIEIALLSQRLEDVLENL